MDAPLRPARRSLSVVLFAVAFGTNVSTPLLLVYEPRLGLSSWTVTAIFAVYPLGLAPALVYAGPASDALGRHRVVLPGLALSGVASVVMILGRDDVVFLFVGRFLLGVASGLVFVVASAWMQDLGVRDGTDPMWTARLLGLIMYGGFGLGPLAGGVLGQWAAFPLVSPYLVHLAIVAAGLVLIGRVPETVEPDRRPIRPNLGIPPGAGGPFWRIVVPTALGVFGLPSLAFGLFPVLLRPEMGSVAVFATGMIFVLSMGLIVPAQAWVGRVGADRAAPVGMALGTIGVAFGLVAFSSGWWGLLFPGSIALGAASGLCMTAGLTFVGRLADDRHRGALTGAFYAATYAAMTSPLVASTFARAIGYDAVLVVILAIGAALAGWLVVATRQWDTRSVVSVE